jgi:TolB-like protein/Tfp pilus assembly protein PilF
MATGEPPFRRTTDALLFDAVLNREPAPVSDRSTEAPSGLQEIIAKALKKDRNERYRTASEIRSDLKGLAASLESKRAEPIAERPKGLSYEQRFADSIAVLPFENVSGDPDAEYLSDGIAETILSNLSQLEKVRVVPRTTAFQFKGKAADPGQVGRQLGVRVVLTGRATARGDDLIVGAELIDAACESQIWGGRYNRKMEDIFAMQEDIAREIASRLRVHLGDEERKRLARRPTENREAYQFFLKAVHNVGKWTPEGLRKAIEYFRNAVEEDPFYADPYAGLAFVYGGFGMLGVISAADAFPKAKAAALKALEIEEESGLAHAALAIVKMLFEWDWSGAGREFARALEIAPNSSYCRMCHGLWLIAMGRYKDGLAEMTMAADLEPLSSFISHQLAFAYWAAGYEHKGIEEYLRTIDLNPSFAEPYGQLALIYARKGMHERSLHSAEKFMALCGRRITGRALLARVHAISGKREQAVTLVKELEKEVPSYGSTGLALVYGALGEAEATLEWLQKAYEERAVFLVFLPIESEWRFLHGDPRFADLLRRIGLPQPLASEIKRASSP